MSHTPAVASQIVHAAWTDEAEGLPVFRAFGDPDDALRLTVLLADRLGSQSETRALQAAAEACKQKDMPWAERLYHVKRLLEYVPRPSSRRYIGAIVDLDALYARRPRGAKLWRDAGLQAQRSAFFECIRDAIDRGGWLVLRPNARDEVTKELPLGVVRPDVEPREIASALRPVLSWLIDAQGALDSEDAHEILQEQGADVLEIYVLTLAYELLKPSVRQVGQRLSALRGPQVLNGALGGFALLPEETSAEPDAVMAIEAVGQPAVDKRAVEALEACGFLQRHPARKENRLLHMPPRFRSFLRTRERLENPDRWQKDNDSLGAMPFQRNDTPFDHLPIDEQIEVHHHAVEAGNLDLARKTARYYGADLREIAYRLSRQRRYDDAAKVYRIIVNEFDRDDAYAWEYLGYNIALGIGRRRREGGAGMTQSEREEILAAYKNAVEKETTDNPLYQGRLLGFRAELGERVGVEFDRRMSSYRESRWPKTAMGYFARAVFTGLVRGGQIELRNELENRWRSALDGNPFYERAHDD